MTLLYMVVAEPYLGHYGSVKHCLGVFTSKTAAEQVEAKYKSMASNIIKNAQDSDYIKKDPDSKIIEFELNKEYITMTI